MDPSVLSMACTYVYEGWKRVLFTHRPLFLTLFVTSRCNARCGHCFIRPPGCSPGGEMSLDEIAMLARHLPLIPKVLIGGGEPFLREDLDEICVLLHRCAGVRQLTIPTNGLLGSAVERVTRSVATRADGLLLEVQISLDGVGEGHDRARGVPGAFACVVETYQRLRRVRSAHPNVKVRFNFTFSALTQEAYPWVHDLVRVQWGEELEMVLVRGEVVDPSRKLVDAGLYRRAYELLRGEPRGGLVERVLQERVRREKELVHGVASGHCDLPHCVAGLLTGVISETGDVLPCEILGDSFGRLRDVAFDFDALWFSPRARAFRERLRRRECACTFESALRASMSFDVREIARILGRALVPRGSRLPAVPAASREVSGTGHDGVPWGRPARP